jgi:hypothetical protein
MALFRRNGRTKTWKTRPDEFHLPVKYGFRGTGSYITHINAADWHVDADCPVYANKEEE